MIKHNLVSLGPAILASRMVRDYTEGYYLPAAATSRRLASDDFAASRELANWKRHAAAAWPGVSVRRVENGVKERLLGARFTVRAFVELGDLDPNEVEVQVAYGRVDDADELPQVELTTLKQVGQRTPDGWTFEGEVPLATPGAFGYTVRVVPRHVGLASAPELGLVAWA
jgi:starch phosphorylase